MNLLQLWVQCTFRIGSLEEPIQEPSEEPIVDMLVLQRRVKVPVITLLRTISIRLGS